MKTLIAASVLVLAASSASANPYNDLGCVGCHGPNGKSTVPTFPKLAGQHAEYLVDALKQYQDGTRNNATMNAMAQLAKGKETIIADFLSKQK
jgi:cytochrome c553